MYVYEPNDRSLAHAHECVWARTCLLMCAHTHTRAHARTHTHTHTHTHARTHVRTRAHTRALARAHTHKLPCSNSRTHLSCASAGVCARPGGTAPSNRVGPPSLPCPLSTPRTQPRRSRNTCHKSGMSARQPHSAQSLRQLKTVWASSRVRKPSAQPASHIKLAGPACVGNTGCVMPTFVSYIFCVALWCVCVSQRAPHTSRCAC